MCINILSTFIYKRKNEPTVSSQIKKTQQTRLKVKEEAEECVGFYFKKVSGRQTEDTQGELRARAAADALEFETASENPSLLSLT